MEKINNLEGIKKYFCSEYNHFHIKKYKYIINEKGKRIKTKNTPFFNHKEFAYKLTNSEIFNKGFKKKIGKIIILNLIKNLIRVENNE